MVTLYTAEHILIHLPWEDFSHDCNPLWLREAWEEHRIHFLGKKVTDIFNITRIKLKLVFVCFVSGTTQKTPRDSIFIDLEQIHTEMHVYCQYKSYRQHHLKNMSRRKLKFSTYWRNKTINETQEKETK